MSFKVPNLDELWNRDPLLAEALQSLRDGIDTLGTKLSVNPQGTTIAPAPPSAINVAAKNGVTHVTLTDNNPRTRHVQYFVEWDTNTNFSNAHTHPLHVSRGARIPTFMGSTPIYVRAYSMLPDGSRSPIVYYGSPNRPTAIVDGASSSGPSLPSTTGSGTSKTPGQGFGREQFISPPTTPGKRPKTY